MTTAGLIMAGGQSLRMAQSGVTTPKPLVEIAGRSLLEHNVRALLCSDVREIYISVRAEASAIVELIEATCRPLVTGNSGLLNVLVESTPLGNIGALGMLPDHVSNAVVVFADNLTALQLTGLVRHHESTNAALTLAAHLHTFTMPFGELDVDGSSVRAYHEKPTLEYLVASAVSVASREAIVLARSHAPLGISALTNLLLDTDAVVETYRHTAPWIDVNDHAEILRAADLVRDNTEAFAWFLSNDDADV